jgi:predicted MFS family arabinose efflux permease
MRPWLTLALLWVAATLNYLDRQALFALFHPLRADLGLADWQLGLLSTAFLWVYGAVSPLGGYLADRYSRRAVILVSLAVWSLVTAATGAARNYTELVAARALMGLSEAFYLPAALALIADYHRPNTRSLATGIHQSGLYAGIILGGAGAGWMGQHFGWRSTFFGLGIAGLVYALVAALLLKDAPRDGHRPEALPRWAEGLAQLARTPSYLVVAAVFTVASMAYWMVYTWMPLYLLERFRMSLAGAGFSSTFYIQTASFFAILAGGWASDRWSRRRPGARALVQAAGFALAGPFLFLTGATGTVAVLIAALVLFGLGRGLYDCNVMPVVCEVVDPRLRATAYGILNLLGCVAGGVMAALAGALKSSLGLGGALQVSGALLIGCALLLARLAWRERRDDAIA